MLGPMKPMPPMIVALLALVASPSYGVGHIEGVSCLKPKSLVSASQRAVTGADPLSTFRKSPIEINQHEDLLWFNKEMLDSIEASHDNLAAQREIKQRHFQQTQQDEINYVNHHENMVANYIRTVLRRRLLSLGNEFKTRFVDGIKEKNKSDKFANRQKDITVTHFDAAAKSSYNASIEAENAKKLQATVATSDQATIAKGKISVTKIIVSEDKGMSLGKTLENAMKTVVQIGRNIVERHQPIDFSDDTHARIKFDMPQATMRLDFESPVFNADAQYRVSNAPVPFTGGPSINPLQNIERSSVGVHRSFKALDLGAGVRYGINTGNLSYGLTKTIAGPLSASVSRVEALGNQGLSDTTVQLSVGLGL
jgi:hypothetical protein